jgi:hypothetical protein
LTSQGAFCAYSAAVSGGDRPVLEPVYVTWSA